MIRSLFKAVVLLGVLVGGGAFLLGYWGSGQLRNADGLPTAVNPERAREVGAKVGETAAAAADQGRRVINEGAITAKIKAKMALDERVKALDIDVDTVGTTVTVSGVVSSDAQKQRALQLARETDGVRQVIDQLQLKK
jgi:hyperosmotically inducible protein